MTIIFNDFPVAMELRMVIHWKKTIYDDLIITPLSVSCYEGKCIKEPCGLQAALKSNEITTCAPKYLNDRRINAYVVSAYIDTLKRSQYYRQAALKRLLHSLKLKRTDQQFPVILVKLRFPRKQFLDYKWGGKVAHMAMERKEVDHAMSWLSTLGGAFSALGECFEHCAVMAGKISIHQLKLALRLGDPRLEARCKLYAALSIIQRGNLRMAKHMIRDIFDYGKEQKDLQLQKMCQGVWAKLGYCYKLRRERKKKAMR